VTPEETHPTEGRRKLDPMRGVGYLHGSIWGRYLLCLLLATILVVGKRIFLEPLGGYESNRLWTFDLVQKALALHTAERSPVAVVNISDIAKEPSINVAPAESPDEAGATSRDALLSLFEKLAPAKPKAIAVDIDFSADSKGNPITLDDELFFKKCLSFERKNNIPIFLGVDRHASDEPAKWLGQGFENLAGGLAIGNDRYQGRSEEMETKVDRILRMFCWTQIDGVQTSLRSLAFAAGKAARPQPAELGPALSWAVEAESNFDPDPALKTRGFLVDYHLIDMLDQSAVPSKSIESPVEATDGRFGGRVIVLGAVRTVADDERILKRTDDLFRVPGHPKLYSGVLLHGCAIDTLVRAPLRQWTPSGRIAADFVLTLFANSLIELLTWLSFRKRKHKRYFFRIYWSVTAFSVLLLGLIVVPFVGVIRLVWDDAFIVALALVLHTAIDHWLVRELHKQEHEAEQTSQEPSQPQPDDDPEVYGGEDDEP